MVLKSALEDFEASSLGSIPGLLGKLHYLAALHNSQGYSHWGLGKVYGKDAAQRAIRASHTALLAQVLRTPLRVLAQDLDSSASREQVPALEFIFSLETRAAQALPEHPQAASQKHLMSVLHALSALVRSQGPATRPGASPLPQPGQ